MLIGFMQAHMFFEAVLFFTSIDCELDTLINSLLKPISIFLTVKGQKQDRKQGGITYVTLTNWKLNETNQTFLVSG